MANRPTAQDTSFFGHPRGLSTLFFTEMWERFGYYGMRALLILFMTASVTNGGLGFDAKKAGIIYGLYTAAVYLMALPGGWLADRFLGQQRAVLVGGVVIAAGHFLLMAPLEWTFYLGLALVATGTGLLKPNISVIVGQLYAAEDRRRDAGFSIFYMGINIGSFLAPLASGWVGERINWRYGFGLAGVGMTLGVVQYLLGRARLEGAGAEPAAPESGAAAAAQLRHLVIGVIGFSAVIGLIAALAYTGAISAEGIANASAGVLLGIVVLFFAWMFSSSSWTTVERRRLTVIFGLFLASALFWSVFEQAGSTMNLFAQRSTDRNVGGFEMPASWFQSINALLIITLAPVFAWLWLRLGSRDPSSPAKFSWGLLLVGLGFVVLAGGAAIADGGVQVSPAWLLVAYLLHTMGELCLSPVGLSAMTKLAPERVAGLMMGVWFLSLSVGNFIGGRVASFYEAFPLPLLFGAVGGFAVVAGLVLAGFVRPMVRLMGGVK